MSSIIRRRRGLMGVSVMGGLPEIGLNTQSSDSSPLSVTALLIAPGARLRVALYRESGLVPRPETAVQAMVGGGREADIPPGRSHMLAPATGPRRARQWLRRVYDENLIGSCRGPRTVPSDHATSPASVKRGMRFSHSSTATVISRRARFEPTQRWMPRPNAECRFSLRSMITLSASGNTAGSRFAAGKG